jgi:hypothetical protein
MRHLSFSIDSRNFPAAENRAISQIWAAMHSANSHIAGFEYALSLFDSFRPIFTRENLFDRTRDAEIHKYAMWSHIAARDGAMQIFHVWKSFAAVSHTLPRCPSLQAKVDGKGVTTVIRLFKSTFPNAEGLRYISAHLAEASLSASKHSVKSFDPQTAPVMTVGGLSLNERSYSASYKGTLVSYELSQETADKMLSLLERLAKCFYEVNEWRDQPTFWFS